jgi:chromosome segregation ATPase
MEAADVLSPDELGRLETACVVLDNEVERILNVRSARDDVAQITARVRALLALAEPVYARLRAVDQEIAQLEARRPQLLRQLEEVERRHQAQREAWQADVLAHEAEIAELTRARDGLQTEYHGERNNLERDLQAVRAEREAALAAREEASLARLEEKAAELAVLEDRIAQAQQLLGQLTALR